MSGWKERIWDGSKKEEGAKEGLEECHFLWQAKTAAVLKLQFSATVPQGYMFVPAYICGCICVDTKRGECQCRDGEGGKD